MAADPGLPRQLLTRVLGVEHDELPPVAAGMLMFFLLFAGYFMLRPVRETMGIAGGVGNLQWLFTGTFVATLAAIPLFGWIAGRAPRRRILAWTYGFFALNLLAFSTKKVAADVRKVLQSAIANAENNHDLDVDDLVVAEATVGKNLVMKRFHARARGRASRIEKPFSQIRIVVRAQEEQA